MSSHAAQYDSAKHSCLINVIRSMRELIDVISERPNYLKGKFKM